MMEFPDKKLLNARRLSIYACSPGSLLPGYKTAELRQMENTAQWLLHSADGDALTFLLQI
jgi:hypothetical protein